MEAKKCTNQRLYVTITDLYSLLIQLYKQPKTNNNNNISFLCVLKCLRSSRGCCLRSRDFYTTCERISVHTWGVYIKDWVTQLKTYTRRHWWRWYCIPMALPLYLTGLWRQRLYRQDTHTNPEIYPVRKFHVRISEKAMASPLSTPRVIKSPKCMFQMSCYKHVAM